MLIKKDREILRHIELYKAISINQAAKITNRPYESVRRRLKQLEEQKILKSYINTLTKEKVYYIEDKVSAHRLYVMDFYAELIKNGAKITKFKLEPRYLNDLVRADAFIEFQYQDNLYFIILEVDLNHFTSNSKMQLYEKLCRERTLQEKCYGVFPTIVILKNNIDITYKSKNFEVIYLDFTLNNFNSKIF
ncbi:hypothetical protein [Clostridium cadaveris]|uniref:hypothetical protein n=1 Tax=Clostridium cadaveris TaxID=1529 RepID=UPI001E47FF9D|nr:hypothetical protein [Clostridium cadaveris]UFH66428.1 hypothetical protein KQH81_07875 [Clostridium cadaveris]